MYAYGSAFRVPINVSLLNDWGSLGMSNGQTMDMRPNIACTPDDTVSTSTILVTRFFDTTGSSLFLTAQDSFSRVLCNPPLEIFQIRAMLMMVTDSNW
ncbi:hypothetical protein ABKN59_009709 [Abortiporus biennis]